MEPPPFRKPGSAPDSCEVGLLYCNNLRVTRLRADTVTISDCADSIDSIAIKTVARIVMRIVLRLLMVK